MESRQVRRATEREMNKFAVAAVREKLRRSGRRALLERQTAREKAGIYDGHIPVAALITPSRSRVTKRKVRKDVPFGRVLREQHRDGRKMAYHATKGWRAA
jgi:hypothetical protein